MSEKKPSSPVEAGLQEHRAEYLMHRPDSVAKAVEDVQGDLQRMTRIMEEEPARMAEMIANMKMIATYLKSVEKLAKNNEDHAAFDTLTELPNLRSFNYTLQADISHAIRRESEEKKSQHLHVLFIDLDNFKSINDSKNLGHDVGDLYLKTVATSMRGALRQEDLIARKGGDEFVAILLDLDEEVVRGVAEKLREAVAEGSMAAKREYGRQKMTILNAGEANVTASIGIASFKLGDSADDLTKRADTAMYKAKRAGRNRIVVAE